MTLAPPSLSDFRIRYSAFANVADATIIYWLADATREVDESWPFETDRDPAMIAVAAHNMMVDNVAGLSGGQIAGLVAQGVTEFKSASFMARLSDDAVKQALAGGYESTRPGLEYLRLLRRNKGGPGVTAPGIAPPCSVGFNGFAGPLPGYWPLP
jgi:hypothetical protein